jgi:carboxylesterase type B
MFKKDLKSPSLSEKGSIIKKLVAFICSVWLTMGTFAQVSQLKPKYPVGVSYSIPFDTVSNVKGQEQVLKIDVYAPIQKSEIKNRPTVLLLFGGGFYWGNKNNYPMETICNRLAQMGLVAISMDYRTRWKKSLSEEEKGATTLYRAVQDLSSAMSFIEQEIKTTNSWKIDTTNFFLGGNSSGAITVLNY